MTEKRKEKKMETITLAITATMTALMAGLFFAWSVSVVPGLARLSDHEYVAAFQAMNRAIQNPIFLFCFMGVAIALPLCAWMQFDLKSLRFWFLVAAVASYWIGVIGVTMIGNVPMNETLDGFQLQGANAAEVAQARLNFEAPWNKLNMIRTIASTVSILFVVLSCLVTEKDID
jgi:uncharacterized membrane protein